jgi:conjugal transfer pilus assembly protein TraE
MKLKIYADKLANLMAENRLLKFCFLITVAITIFNSLVAYHAMNNQKVVILPPLVDHKIEIRGNAADDEYLKMMSRYSINLLLDYTPSNAEQNFSDFLKLASADVFSSMRSDLDKIIEEVIRKISKLGSANRIEIIGLRLKHADDVCIQSGIEHHIIEYNIDDGTFRVTGVSQKNGV